jgi:pyridoxamine 5'-phosphate oxidase
MTVPTQFLDEPLPAEPLSLAQRWFDEAWALRAQPNANSMVVATIDADGRPSARVVLCKEIVAVPGYLTFFTNYASRKGRAIDANPRVAAVLHWDHLHRQVRVEGRIVRTSTAESDGYFASRPWQRRVGAWASAQSAPVASRRALRQQLAATADRLGVPLPGAEDQALTRDPAIPRPPHWGGYRIWADAVELWVEGESRLHDRVRWERTLQPAPGPDGWQIGPWTATRLQP